MNLYARRRTRLAGVLVLALATLLLPLAPQASAATTTVTFNYTGSSQEWIVPEGLTEVTIEAWGAGAHYSQPCSARGGYAKRTVPVSRDQQLTVVVGGTTSDGAGGFNGGGSGWLGGSGASDVRIAGDGLEDRAIVAGGAGGCSPYQGGSGGGLFGEDGRGDSCCPLMITSSGRGGSPIAGGAGGLPSPYLSPLTVSRPGYPGVFGHGGDGGANVPGLLTAGGGGGGGWFGGGGGASWMAGGGGSGYAPGGVLQSGVHSGPGLVTISYRPGAPLPLPEPLPSELPGILPTSGSACSDDTWHFDRVQGDGAGYSYEMDIHNSPTAVEVCTTVWNPAGLVVFDEDVVVPKDTDPSDFLPPFTPPTVDADAPDGEGPGSPCSSSSGAGQGTDNVRGYARTGQSGSDTVVCVGVRAPGTARHVRVTVHQ